MLAPPSSPSLDEAIGIRHRLLRDHAELEELYSELLKAVQSEDLDRMTKVSTRFAARLIAHMELEETFLIPGLARKNERQASALTAEHTQIRARVLEIAEGIDRGTLQLYTALAFIEELRAHARHEDNLFYRWLDQSLSSEAKDAFFDAASLTLPP